MLVPHEFVDAVGEVHEKARRSTPKAYTSEAPQEAISGCEKSHTAANESRKKAAGEIHDDRGLLVVACRHDQPVLWVNIDTPGERQKYAMSALIWLKLLLPRETTVTVLYDIGCVTHRILRQVSETSPDNNYD